MEKTLTIKQVAQMLGYSTNSVYAFVKEGKIRSVRVGKGRFRVPLSEVERVLGVEKKSPDVFTARPSMTIHAFEEKKDSQWAERFLHKCFGAVSKESLEKIHIFDVFLGIVSIVCSTSMSLYSQLFDKNQATVHLPWQPVLQTGFIVSGIALLAISFLSVKRGWNIFFRVFNAVCFGVLATFLFNVGDYDGALIFGFVGLLSAISDTGILGEDGFMYLLHGIVILIGPLALLLFPNDSHLRFATIFQVPAMPSIVASIGFFGGILLALTRYKYRWLFTVMMWCAIAGFVWVSFWFASEWYWLRGLFFLLLAVFSVVSLYWDYIPTKLCEERRLVGIFFFLVLLTFLAAVGILYIFQVNMIGYTSQQLHQKQVYSSLYVESTIKDITSVVRSYAADEAVIRAFEKKDTSELSNQGKKMLASSDLLYRIIMINPAGDILVYYPYGDPFTVSNLANRDYFIKAITTRLPVVSDVFQAQTVSGQYRIAISAPVISAKGDVLGVVAVGLLIDSIGVRLQSIASENFGEYVILFDAAKQYIVSPFKEEVGIPITYGFVPNALRGISGTIESMTADRRQVIVSYGHVPSTNWGIAVFAPLYPIFHSSEVAIIVVGVLFTVSVILSYASYAIHSHRAAERSGLARRIPLLYEGRDP